MTDMPSSAPPSTPAPPLKIRLRPLNQTERYERAELLWSPPCPLGQALFWYQNIRGAERVSSNRPSARWFPITLLYWYALPIYMLSFLGLKQQEAGPSAWVGLQIKGDDRLAKGFT